MERPAFAMKASGPTTLSTGRPLRMGRGDLGGRSGPPRRRRGRGSRRRGTRIACRRRGPVPIRTRLPRLLPLVIGRGGLGDRIGRRCQRGCHCNSAAHRLRLLVSPPSFVRAVGSHGSHVRHRCSRTSLRHRCSRTSLSPPLQPHHRWRQAPRHCKSCCLTESIDRGTPRLLLLLYRGGDLCEMDVLERSIRDTLVQTNRCHTPFKNTMILPTLRPAGLVEPPWKQAVQGTSSLQGSPAQPPRGVGELREFPRNHSGSFWQASSLGSSFFASSQSKAREAGGSRSGSGSSSLVSSFFVRGSAGSGSDPGSSGSSSAP